MAWIEIIEEEHQVSCGDVMMHVRLRNGIALKRDRIAFDQMRPASIAQIIDGLCFGKTFLPE